jgi:hypothetical protein
MLKEWSLDEGTEERYQGKVYGTSSTAVKFETLLQGQSARAHSLFPWVKERMLRSEEMERLLRCGGHDGRRTTWAHNVCQGPRNLPSLRGVVVWVWVGVARCEPIIVILSGLFRVPRFQRPAVATFLCGGSPTGTGTVPKKQPQQQLANYYSSECVVLASQWFKKNLRLLQAVTLR